MVMYNSNVDATSFVAFIHSCKGGVLQLFFGLHYLHHHWVQLEAVFSKTRASWTPALQPHSSESSNAHRSQVTNGKVAQIAWKCWAKFTSWVEILSHCSGQYVILKPMNYLLLEFSIEYFQTVACHG